MYCCIVSRCAILNDLEQVPVLNKDGTSVQYLQWLTQIQQNDRSVIIHSGNALLLIVLKIGLALACSSIFYAIID